MSQNFTTPTGRLVMGSLYKPQTTNAEGKPLMDQQGRPKAEYFFAVAIPKQGEQHWNQTAWGRMIWSEGQQGFPQAHASPAFAWKVVDGDSNVPNMRGVAPCSREGYPGHWVLSFKSGFAPRTCNSDGTAPSPCEEIKLGSYVQVNANVTSNGSQQRPGVYLNHQIVAFQGYGAGISVGPDPASAGFGQGPTPMGMSAIPVGGLATAPAPAPAPTAPPAPQFLQPPPPVPAAPAAPVMTPKANGQSYEAFKASGWTDDLLRQHGYML